MRPGLSARVCKGRSASFSGALGGGRLAPHGTETALIDRFLRPIRMGVGNVKHIKLCLYTGVRREKTDFRAGVQQWLEINSPIQGRSCCSRWTADFSIRPAPRVRMQLTASLVFFLSCLMAPRTFSKSRAFNLDS